MMRGGTASVFAKRKFNANNPYMNEKYNPQEKTSYGFMLDANNLYVVLCKCINYQHGTLS